MTDHPRLVGAPGHQWRRRDSGRWVCLWVARRDIVESGYEPQTQRLWPPTATPDAVFDEAAALYIKSECTRLQDDMHSWKNGGNEPRTDGPIVTVDDLIAAYKSDPDSDYQELRPRSVKNYNSNMKQISDSVVTDEKDQQYRIGGRGLAKIRGRDFKRWFEVWSDEGKRVPRASARMRMFRIMTSFGSSLLEHQQCKRVREILSDQAFQQGRRRKSIITAEQVTAIREVARRRHPSVALAEALKFDLMSRPKDVLGEYIPMRYPGISAVVRHGEKWLYGFDWSALDVNFVLTHRLSKSLRGKRAISNPDVGEIKRYKLGLAPMVMEEFSLIAGVPVQALRREMFPASGPMIIQEGTDMPYPETTYRDIWRRYATKAKVPLTVQPRDTRPGAATEAKRLGGRPEEIQQAMGHKQITTTWNYLRDDDETTADIAELRAAKRPVNKVTNGE